MEVSFLLWLVFSRLKQNFYLLLLQITGPTILFGRFNAFIVGPSSTQEDGL
jgi:hypothetical protein